MKSQKDIDPSVIQHSMSMLPLEKFSCPLLNYDYKKLSIPSLVKIFVAAQLGGWLSYSDMEEKLRSYPELLEYLGLNSISGSQLSRRIIDLPTEIVQELFFEVAKIVMDLSSGLKGLPKGLGRLRIVDSTHIRLSEQLCNWAFISKGKHDVKMHTRLVVASTDTVFVDKIVPSTGKVSDFEGSDHLVETSLEETEDVTYIFDRGYACQKRMENWLKLKIRFVVRIRWDRKILTIDNREVPEEDSHILRDAEVILGSTKKMKQSLRLVEYVDEKLNVYRVITNRWDLKATQIAELYKHRWKIELFFKWIKQHLRVTNVWSTKPQGIWNQMFLALIAHALTVIVKLTLNAKKTDWQIARLIKTYFDKSWNCLLKEIFRKGTKTSKGRGAKRRDGPAENLFVGDVAIVKL